MGANIDTIESRQLDVLDHISSDLGAFALNEAIDEISNDDDDRNNFSEESDDEAQLFPRLNTAEEIGNGIIKTNKNKSNEYTILLVGETGTGKTCLLSLLANVLTGHSPSNFVSAHDPNNEAGGLSNQSQTNLAKLYELTSNNGVKVRILDTPGLGDTRGLNQDELHKASIAHAIKENISNVNAVIILANGTVERLGVATDYALSALSSMFPRTLADNIGILFTNVASPLSWNFNQNSLPDSLRGIKNKQFLLDNPLAMWKRLIQIRNQRKPNKRVLAELESAVNESCRKALQELALLFDWLDTLEPQPTKDIVSLYEQSQEIERSIANALSRASQLANKKTKLTKIKEQANGSKLTMEQYRNYKNVITKDDWEQVKVRTPNTICLHPQCFSNCVVNRVQGLSFYLYLILYDLYMRDRSCRICGHPLSEHNHSAYLWKKQGQSQEIVDEEAERKYNEARQKNIEQRTRIVDLDKDIADLDTDVQDALRSLGQLTESYASLSLMGSFAGQVRKSIRLLELNLEAMCQSKADPKSLEMVERGMEIMKEKLRLVEQADGKARKNVGRMVMKMKEKAHEFVGCTG